MPASKCRTAQSQQRHWTTTKARPLRTSRRLLRLGAACRSPQLPLWPLQVLTYAAASRLKCGCSLVSSRGDELCSGCNCVSWPSCWPSSWAVLLLGVISVRAGSKRVAVATKGTTRSPRVHVCHDAGFYFAGNLVMFLFSLVGVFVSWSPKTYNKVAADVVIIGEPMRCVGASSLPAHHVCAVRSECAVPFRGRHWLGRVHLHVQVPSR